MKPTALKDSTVYRQMFYFIIRPTTFRRRSFNQRYSQHCLSEWGLVGDLKLSTGPRAQQNLAEGKRVLNTFLTERHLLSCSRPQTYRFYWFYKWWATAAGCRGMPDISKEGCKICKTMNVFFLSHLIIMQLEQRIHIWINLVVVQMRLNLKKFCCSEMDESIFLSGSLLFATQIRSKSSVMSRELHQWF